MDAMATFLIRCMHNQMETVTSEGGNCNAQDSHYYKQSEGG